MTQDEVKRVLYDTATFFWDWHANLRSGFPAGYSSGWPDVVREFVEAYGYTDVRVRRPMPSPAQIDQIDQVFGWVELAGDEFEILRLQRKFHHGRDTAERTLLLRRRVMLCTVMGKSLRKTAHILGRSHEGIRNFLDDACERIADRNNLTRANRTDSIPATMRTPRFLIMPKVGAA